MSFSPSACLHFYLPTMNNYSQGDLYAALDGVHFSKMESQHSEIYDLGERMWWKKRVKSSLKYSTLGFAWINQWILVSLLQFELSFIDGLWAVKCRGLLCTKS